jgi:hypothetical protein
VISAAGIDTPEAADFLITALHDVDEKLQTLALRELVAKKNDKTFDTIQKIVTHKNFKNRSAEQIKEFLEGFAVLGGRNAFELLKKIIKRRMLLTTEKDKRLKNYAVRALGFVNTAEATGLLEKISGSRNRLLADTARRNLKRKPRGNTVA